MAVSKIEVNSTSSTLTDGLSKYWLNFSMAGTTQRSDSLNSGSITDNGTGDFTLAFTNNFNYEGYCITYCIGGHDSSDGHWDYDGGTYDQLTSSIQVKAFTQGSSIATRDAIGNNWSAKGDLA
tara:strand:- start:526 stop:894 length:369 start_codon:yes stop_codon:yes gene_type:complete